MILFLLEVNNFDFVLMKEELEVKVVLLFMKIILILIEV